MSTNNVTFVFGTGNIMVQPGYIGIRIYVTDKPNKCGSLVDQSTDLNGYEHYEILISNSEEYLEFSNKLGLIESKKSSKFEFGGYAFDFSNYNQASVDVMRSAIDELFKIRFATCIVC